MFPQDFDGLHEQINELMQQEDRPTGIISASDRLVGFMASCAQKLRLSIPGDLELVFESQVEPGGALAQYPYVKPRLSFHEVATTVARLLKRVAEGEQLANRRVVIPVELHANGKVAGAFS
jgi:DNA-binding LacI/PurR family transcriptional regulator